MSTAERIPSAFDIAMSSEAEIAGRLAKQVAAPQPSRAGSDPPLTPAAVLMPLARVDGAWHLVFIRRAENRHDNHSGQVAFPGGRMEAGDASPQDAALREAFEEIGLDPCDVAVLGRLPALVSVTNYTVTPVVGRIPWPYTFRLQASEVSRTFSIPLRWLAEPDNRETRTHALPQIATPVPVVYFRAFDGDVLWGASARMTVSLIEALSDDGGRP